MVGPEEGLVGKGKKRLERQCLAGFNVQRAPGRTGIGYLNATKFRWKLPTCLRTEGCTNPVLSFRNRSHSQKRSRFRPLSLSREAYPRPFSILNEEIW